MRAAPGLTVLAINSVVEVAPKSIEAIADDAGLLIPEIWQDHVNTGEGSFTAWERLEKWL
ncbi:hypothetical protein [Rothia uropygialis]|uniref:hypothetical protein n=1 Tax=Kocuria sp. 36 TaxID=1415402 RepID=UPI0013EE1092|nr:hypothetical protein [Kocuria sp. 36]